MTFNFIFNTENGHLKALVLEYFNVSFIGISFDVTVEIGLLHGQRRLYGDGRPHKRLWALAPLEETQEGGQGPAHVMTGPFVDEAVEDWVRHAIEAGERQSHVISTKQVLLGATVAGIAEEEHAAPQQEDVVGSEAEEDDEDQTEGQPLDFSLLLSLGRDVTAHGSQDASVRGQHHTPRRQEAEKSSVKVHPGHPVLHGILLEAEGVVEAVLEKFVMEERRRVRHYFGYPYNGADQ